MKRKVPARVLPNLYIAGRDSLAPVFVLRGAVGAYDLCWATGEMFGAPATDPLAPGAKGTTLELLAHDGDDIVFPQAV